MSRPTRLGWYVAAAFALAVAVRWAVAIRYYRDLPLGLTDNYYYHSQANLLAEGRGFLNPFALIDGREGPTAAHPPLYSLYLAAWSLLGASTPLWHRLASGLVSATAVAPVALTAARLAGPRAAAAAAAVVAVHPVLWMNDGLILSESLYIPLAAAGLWQAHRFIDRPGIGRAAGLAAVLALGALTRSESLLLLFALLAPLVWRSRATAKERLQMAGVAAAVALAVLAPWVVRNLVTFEEPTILSVGQGYVLELANCDDTYSGPLLGYWSAACDSGEWAEGDESVVGAAKLNRALEYIGDHLSRQPVVAAARAGRLFGLFRPFQTADFDVFFEGRVDRHVRVGLWAQWGLSLLAVGGAVVLWRRRRPLWPSMALIGTAALTAAVSFGITRYRAGADVAIVVLAGVALGALLNRLRPSTPPQDESSGADSATPGTPGRRWSPVRRRNQSGRADSAGPAVPAGP